ncbi:hypothetical protein PS708_04252 [Pseudomonas fluorescens]|nr:hypothetical protein PS708_04252 [Pseudomonas fluorescens]
MHAGGQAGDRALYPGDHFLAAAGEGIGGLGEIPCGACVLGNVMNRCSHLVDGGGGLVGFTLLAEHAVLYLVHAAGQPCGAIVQLPGGVRHGVHDALVTGLHRVERAGHLADFVLARQGYASRQIAGFLYVQHHVLEGVELAEQEADQQLRRAEHRQHQDQDRHCIVGEAFLEHLAQAGRVGKDGNVLTIRAGDDFSAQQRVITEHGHRVELDPTRGAAQG